MDGSNTTAAETKELMPLVSGGWSAWRMNFLNETEMKYMLLIYDDEVVFGKIAKEEQEQILAESVRFTHELHANNQYLSAGPLQPGATAAVVRVRQGKPFVTDGPFAETREQIAGYFLIHAKDREEAISIAARVPCARIGTVEVRPVIEISGLPNT
jgi:hypothetical protein